MNKLALRYLSQSQEPVIAQTLAGEDNPPKIVTGVLHIQNVLGNDHYVIAGRNVEPETIRTIKTSSKALGMTCMFCGAKEPDTDQTCPNAHGARHILVSGVDKEFWGQGYGPGPGQSGAEYDPDTLGWDGKKKIENPGLKHSKLAWALSNDGKVRSCPFCSSGNVWGGSDGTINCETCDAAFTVTLEPEHPFMPQNLNGNQYNLDGSIQDPGAKGQGQPPGFLDNNSDPSQGDEEEPGSPEDEETPQNGSKFQASKRYYLTKEYDVIDEDSYLAHLASRL